ncbi:MAG: hypothetical protein AB7I30_03885 [Isosphaeraceae bacterium]
MPVTETHAEDRRALALSPRVPRASSRREVRPATRSRASRVPLGLLGMLGMVLLVESAVAERWESFTDPVAFSWRYSLDEADRAGGFDVLCLGDSLAKHGLVPPVMTSVNGRSARNLAAAASPAPLTYFALRRALNAGARPAAVVLEYKPSVLAGGPKLRSRCWAEALSGLELVDLIRTSKSATLAAELLVGAALPSVRARHDVRENLLRALRGESSRLRSLNAICRRNWSVNGGANVASRQPGFTGAVPEEVHRNLLSDRFAANRVNADYVRRTLELASRHGISTYLVIPPFAPELLARRAETGAEARFSQFVRSLQTRHPAVTVLDARESGYPASAFVDASHLDRLGAVALSLDVGEALRRTFEEVGGKSSSRGRWIILPRFQARPDPVVLEDVEQSRERLGIAWEPSPKHDTPRIARRGEPR